MTPLDGREADLAEGERQLVERLAEVESSSRLLREANEQLLVATVSAQAMTEVALRATTLAAHQAEHDYLTGLPNRALLMDRLARAMTLARRNATHVALMFVDLDHFKNVNDTLGHLVGDELLRSVTRRLLSCVRLSDTVSRHGGDEFVLLLELKSIADASATAQKVLHALAEPHVLGAHRLKVTASIGLSLYPEHGVDVDTMLRDADVAMYQAKRLGRNGFCLFQPELDGRAQTRRSVEQALQHALAHGQLELRYQPKVNLETRAVTGVEALVRLNSDLVDFSAPGDFLGVAETTGLILPIGRWVLGEACRQAAHWRREGLGLGQISVNVSPVELHSADFVDHVREALDDAGLEPRRLELELTERGLLQDPESTSELLAALKTLGVRLALDDFGTGFSSLSALRRLPIDTLKIDQSLVRELGEGPGSSGLVSAVIAVGQSLAQHVVAEGIETEAQASFLSAHHCVEGQGYLFSRPLPAGRFEAQLRKAPLPHQPRGRG